jgi:hypothetical protein
MKSRLLTLLLVFVMALGLVPAVAAQDAADMTCLNLAADDCAVLKEADANSVNIKSFVQSYKFSLKISGVPNQKDITITSDGTGPIAVDESKMNAENPAGGLTMGLDLNGAMAGTGQDSSGKFSMVIVGGNFYMKNQKGAWIGVPLAEVFKGLSASGMPFNPQTLMSGSGAAGAMAQNPAAALAALGLKDVDPMKILNTPGFLTAEKMEAQDMNGVSVTPFAYTVDFVPLFASQDFQKLIQQIAANSKDPQTQQMGMMATMLPMLVKTGTVKVTRWVGDDKFIHGFGVDVNAVVDTSAMGGGGGAAAGPITLTLSFQVQLDKLNEAVDVKAPEGATLATSMEEFGKLASAK